MRSRFINLALLLGGFIAVPESLLSVAQVEAKPIPASAHLLESQTQRRNVIDYFNLLPALGIGYPATQRAKRQLLQPECHPIIDMRDDYLLIHPDSSPAEQIAVFRARGKSDLVAVSLPDSKSDYNDFTLFRLQNGKLRDVTRQMLPMPADTDHLLYELPQFGTTIRVFRFNIEAASRHHVFDLQWRSGHLIKVR